MTTANVTIEQLAEKLGEIVWSKGDLKRIYLNDEGYNTKKMSTKTFIWQDEDGNFQVSCRIDCPSQGVNWIKSQEEEVRANVFSKIDAALATEYFFAKNKETGLYFDKLESKDCSYNEVMLYPDYFKSSSEIKEYFENENISIEKYEIVKIDREKCESESEIAWENHRKEIELRREVAKIEAEKTETSKPVAKMGTTDNPEYGIGSKVNHASFGIGEVTEEDKEKVHINFESVGTKMLIKRFAKLEKVQ